MENLKLDGNEYYKVSDNMKKIKSFSLENKIPVIVVSQVSRNDSRSGINLFSGKGSGEVENSSNFVLALSKVKPENANDYGLTESVLNQFDTNHISLLSLQLLKNRRGRCGSCIIEMNRKTLEIYQSKLNE